MELQESSVVFHNGMLWEVDSMSTIGPHEVVSLKRIDNKLNMIMYLRVLKSEINEDTVFNKPSHTTMSREFKDAFSL